MHKPPGCSRAGWDTAAALGQAIASSDFLPIEFLNTSVLHWGHMGSALGGDMKQHTDSQGSPQPSPLPGKCGSGKHAHSHQEKSLR